MFFCGGLFYFVLTFSCSYLKILNDNQGVLDNLQGQRWPRSFAVSHRDEAERKGVSIIFWSVVVKKQA